jgi:hypothetical protein
MRELLDFGIAKNVVRMISPNFQTGISVDAAISCFEIFDSDNVSRIWGSNEERLFDINKIPVAVKITLQGVI